LNKIRAFFKKIKIWLFWLGMLVGGICIFTLRFLFLPIQKTKELKKRQKERKRNKEKINEEVKKIDITVESIDKRHHDNNTVINKHFSDYFK